MANRIVNPVTTADYREFARRRLPAFLFNYIDGGANDERTLARNAADFARIGLRQRVMRDVSEVTTATVLGGEPAGMPLGLAPVGLAGMFGRRGEAEAARASAEVGVPMALSTVSVCPLEEVIQAGGRPVWFQLYMLRDRELVVRLLERAWQQGVRVLVFTVDLAVEGVRHRDARYGMVGATFTARAARGLEILAHPRWVWQVGVRGKPHDFGNLRDIAMDSRDLNAYKAFIGAQFDSRVTWRDIAWLRERWRGKLFIKGVLSGDDARAAVDVGADGVVVSNHGGRQLDGAPSTISRLPEVAAAIGDRAEVLLDGGVRNGVDIVRAVALGARGVLIGRPWAYALAARGGAGVLALLQTFQREMAVAMALMGVNCVAELNPDCLEPYLGSE